MIFIEMLDADGTPWLVPIGRMLAIRPLMVDGQLYAVAKVDGMPYDREFRAPVPQMYWQHTTPDMNAIAAFISALLNRGRPARGSY